MDVNISMQPEALGRHAHRLQSFWVRGPRLWRDWSVLAVVVVCVSGWFVPSVGVPGTTRRPPGPV